MGMSLAASSRMWSGVISVSMDPGLMAFTRIPCAASSRARSLVKASKPPLEAAYGAHSAIGNYAFWLGVIVVLMTAFYSWRLLFMTFHGESRADEKVVAHIHESSKVMVLPLFVLAAGSIGAGYVGYNMTDLNSDFWGQSIFVASSHQALENLHHVPVWVKVLPITLAIVGIVLAYLLYIRFPNAPAKIVVSTRGLYYFLLNKWYFDEFYDWLIVKPIKRLGLGLWKSGDGDLIDGVGPDGIAAAVVNLSRRASNIQSGYIYHYAFAMLIGIALLVTWYIAWAGR